MICSFLGAVFSLITVPFGIHSGSCFAGWFLFVAEDCSIPRFFNPVLDCGPGLEESHRGNLRVAK